MLTLDLNPKWKDIKSIIENPILWRLVYGQSDVNSFKQDWNNNNWLLIKDQYNNHIGCFMVKELTKIVLEVHIFIFPKYWGKNIDDHVFNIYSDVAVELGHEWAKKQGYKKTFTKVPGNCIHMLKFIKNIQYKACGIIENGIYYNNKLVPLLFFEYVL